MLPLLSCATIMHKDVLMPCRDGPSARTRQAACPGVRDRSLEPIREERLAVEACKIESALAVPVGCGWARAEGKEQLGEPQVVELDEGHEVQRCVLASSRRARIRSRR